MAKGKRVPRSPRRWCAGRSAASAPPRPSCRWSGASSSRQTLRDALALLRKGHGGMIEVVGPAGIGKTRLLDELRAGAAGMPQLLARCELYEASSPYLPFRRILRTLLGCAQRAAARPRPPMRLREWVLRDAPELEPWLPLLAVVVDAEVESTPQVDELGEEFRAPKLIEVTIQLFERLVTEPTLIAVEDVHWMDAASVDLAHALIGRAERAAVARLLHPSRRPHRLPAGRAPGRHRAAPPAADGRRLRAPDHRRHRARAAATARRPGARPPLGRQPAVPARPAGRGRGVGHGRGAARHRSRRWWSPRSTGSARRSGGWCGTRRCSGWPSRPTWSRCCSITTTRRPSAGPGRGSTSCWPSDGPGRFRFRHALTRDAAYEGLSYRRRAAAARARRRGDRGCAAQPDDDLDLLALHYLRAGDNQRAWRNARAPAAAAAEAEFAIGDAAVNYGRALEAARHLGGLPAPSGSRRSRRSAISTSAWAATSTRRRRFTEARRLLRATRWRRAGCATSIRSWPSAAAATPRRCVGCGGDWPGWPGATTSGGAAACAAVGLLRPGAARPGAPAGGGQRARARRSPRHSASGEDEALAHAYLALDWALSELGRGSEAVYSVEALGCTRRSASSAPRRASTTTSARSPTPRDGGTRPWRSTRRATSCGCGSATASTLR